MIVQCFLDALKGCFFNAECHCVHFIGPATLMGLNFIDAVIEKRRTAFTLATYG